MTTLFISHDASRTGAPFLLLTFLRWLKLRGGVDFEVLVLHDGPLRAEFEKLAPTYVADALTGRRTLSGRVATRVFGRSEAAWIDKGCRIVARRAYACIYGNSVLSLPWLEAFGRHGNAARICHLHEMAGSIEQAFPAGGIADALSALDAIVACSAAVADDLKNHFGIRAPVRVANAFIDPDIRISQPPAELRRALGLPPTAFVVGGIGRLELRKGVDLLVQLLDRLVRSASIPDVRAIWVGHSGGEELLRFCRHDLRKLGLEDRFLFVEHSHHPNDYINCFDVFAMVSREDPMPLVALAAACLEKPIVTFEGSGGIAEVVDGGCGYKVPYLDVDAMARTVAGIAADPEAARRCGLAAGAKVRDGYALESIAPVLLDVIRSALDKTPRPVAPTVG